MVWLYWKTAEGKAPRRAAYATAEEALAQAVADEQAGRAPLEIRDESGDEVIVAHGDIVKASRQ